MDAAVIITNLWTEIEKAGFNRVRIDEGRHPNGSKINVGYGSGSVRVWYRPADSQESKAEIWAGAEITKISDFIKEVAVEAERIGGAA